MDKEGDNNRQAESQSKAQISIYMYNEKTIIAKLEQNQLRRVL